MQSLACGHWQPSRSCGDRQARRRTQAAQGVHNKHAPPKHKVSHGAPHMERPGRCEQRAPAAGPPRPRIR